MDRVVLTERFGDALAYAARVHREQCRKVSDGRGAPIPYVSHLLAVAALVLEDGGDEDEAIAALLHDAAEDQGGRPCLEEIRRRYGDAVAGIVESCTDTFEDPKPAWRPRKEAYIERLRTASPAVLRVALADKLHNARSTLSDLRLEGDAVWAKFRTGADEQAWYYSTLAGVLCERHPGAMADEMRRAVDELVALIARPGA